MPGNGLWLGIACGLGLGVLYIVASYLSNKRALRSGRNALLIVVSAMMLRIVLALGALVAVMLLLPVAPTAFLGSFFVMFIVGLVLEVWVFHARETAGSPPGA